MQNVARATLFIILVCAFALAGSAIGGEDRYVAIAYSPSTGAYEYGNGYATKAEAIARAEEECGEADAVTKWARNAWLALAVSNDGGYGSGWGTSAAKARELAVESCLEHNETGRVLLCISAYR